MEITTRQFQSPLGLITHFTITNASGASVTLSTLGAGIVSVFVPDKDGHLDNVVLGYREASSWIADGPCAGKIPGRFANRIAKGRFTLDGKEYELAINNGPNALHGGPQGFMNRIWEGSVDDSGSVIFKYQAKDGEEGYPGNLSVTARYSWSDTNELTLELRGETDAPTVINLTNHAYFNLDGEGSGSVLNHSMRLNSDYYLPTDETQIPTGEFAPVENTPMDFREFKKIGQDIKADFKPLKIGKGYDHCWVARDHEKGVLKEVAVLNGATSGRQLIVQSTQPGMQIYTGNWLDGCPESISGGSYKDYDGVAIECQNFPDAPNHPDFPSSVLRPGEEYNETIKFIFK